MDLDLVKEIKQRADIVDVISYYLPSVQKKGKGYVAVCPFHDDHDPSMQISKDKQTFHCFVCQSGGDVIEFVKKYDKCSFEEAVRKVCEIIGYDDPRLHKQTYEKKIDANLVPVYNCINELQKYYVYALTTEEGQVARDYLEKRHLSAEQTKKFGLGYAFKDGQMTIEYLKAKGFSLKNIENTGIALAQTSGMSDNNRGRLIFPIKDAGGQVCGFSARKIVEDPEAAKYVNSPETVIFTKGNILYNYWQAKQTAKHDGYIYVVEGFMDVFALDSIGITSCVALMSTKLTKQHIDLIRRLGVEVRVCLDGDKPGQSAMMKLMAQLDEAHLPYRLVSLPGEIRDPDEILKQDGEETLQKYVNTLVDPFQFALNYYKNISPLGTIEDKKKVVHHFMPMIASIKDRLIQDDYIFKLADATGFSSGAIRNYLKDFKANHNTSDEVLTNINAEVNTEIDVKKLSKEIRRLTLAERTMLDMMFESKEAVAFYEKNVKYFTSEVYRTIANFLVNQVKESGEINPTDLISEMQASEVKNKDLVISEVSAISTKENKTKLTKDSLEEISKVISEERTRLYEKKKLEKELEGKTPMERAKLMAEYLSKNKQI
ncbi:MAG: DNA primase [Firmicutes bacterium]|nr:DNA primase [Candidatus Fiminaster equi]